MADWLVPVVSIGGTLAAVLFGFAAFMRATRHDTTEQARSEGVVLTEIGYVKSGIDDIKRKQETQDKQHTEVISRLTAVEQSAKQAHKRIDEMKGVNSNENQLENSN